MLQELIFFYHCNDSNSLFSILDYFSQHLGEYLNVLSALESLNVAILKAMDKTKEVSLVLCEFALMIFIFLHCSIFFLESINLNHASAAEHYLLDSPNV